MGSELDSLKAQVTQAVGDEQKAVNLMLLLKTKLDAAIASGDPAALTALSAQLGTEDAALEAAITADTPAA